MKPLVIINPVSAHGKTGENWNDIKAKLDQVVGDFDYIFTTKRGHAEKISAEYLKNGGDWLVSVGGDGTLHEVVNGFFENGKNCYPKAALSFVSTGTGGDFLRSVKDMVSDSTEADLLKKPDNRFTEYQIDAAKVESKEGTRFFINMMSAALGGLVVYRINKYKFIKTIGGKAGYYLVTLFTLLTYRYRKTRIELDGRVVHNDYVQDIAVANGKYQGGGMKMAPKAVLNDGLLDLIVVKNPGLIETITLSPKIYTGEHIHHPEVMYCKGANITIDFSARFPQDLDGESYAYPPLKISVLPGAIKLRV